MTLKELNIFYKLSDNRHLNSLAKELQLTQSAISLSIKSLENKLGVKLFDRIGKKLILNDAGREFKRETYEHFLKLKDAQNIFKKDMVFGRLNIALSKTLGEFVMPQTIFNFLVKFPQTEIKRDIQNSTKIIKLVKDGDIDIGFIESNCYEKMIIKEKIGRDSLEIITNDASLTERAYYIDELFKRKWILRESGSGTREIFINSLGELAKELNIFMEFSEFEEAKTLLCNNPDTITCLSRYVVARELQNGNLFRVKLKNLKIQRDFFMIYHKNRYRSRLFNEFRDSVFS